VNSNRKLATYVYYNDSMAAGGRVVTHSPLTPAARVQLPNAALTSKTQTTILSGSQKCEATSKRVITVENCGFKSSRCGSALAGIKRVGGR